MYSNHVIYHRVIELEWINLEVNYKQLNQIVKTIVFQNGTLILIRLCK